MKFRRGKGSAAREEVFINLASLIDVIFVLLLFFVVSTTFIKPEQLSIELPQADSSEVQPGLEKQLEITIDVNGRYALNGEALPDGDLDGLMNALQRVSQGDNSLPLVISADARTAHQAVITAMDAAGKLGFVHLRITTISQGADIP